MFYIRFESHFEFYEEYIHFRIQLTNNNTNKFIQLFYPSLVITISCETIKQISKSLVHCPKPLTVEPIIYKPASV